jgi:cytochrome c oxidase cbb3-type subunit 3
MSEVIKDELTGKNTTGHEWDGIRELDNPMPRWWLMVLYASIVYAVIYWILYPAIPFLHSYSKGLLGYNSHAAYEREAAVATAGQKVWLDKIASSTTDQISANPDLLNYAMSGGKATFNDNCAACHAPGGAGRQNFPVLADDDWMWGGTLAAIEQTIRHGIRSSDPDARNNVMPRFGADGILKPDEISDVVAYVESLGGAAADAAAAGRGKQLFADNCAACHGDRGKGNPELGAPNLTDSIWLYGGDHASLIAQVTKPRQGVMPAWQGRLTDTQIKMLAVYVHSLGGGQ